MNTQEAISEIYKGNIVTCTHDEYVGGLRTAIKDQAGKWIDGKDHLRAMVALEEVKRLDIFFDNFIIPYKKQNQ